MVNARGLGINRGKLRDNWECEAYLNMTGAPHFLKRTSVLRLLEPLYTRAEGTYVSLLSELG